MEVAGTNQARQLEMAQFPDPPYLLPTHKGVGPLVGWAVDCITHLTPAAPNGSTSILVCVCCWSKFVVAKPVPDLKAATITNKFHDEISCLFGVPRWVRVDSGSEFKGDFEAYCSYQGITVRRISANHPRANGQVERYNLTLRQGIRKMTTWVRGAEWWDVLPDIVRGLRMLPHSTLGLTPFALVFKQHPHYHDQLELAMAAAPEKEPSAEEEEALFAAQKAFW